jgi:Putative zinc-finger
VDCRAAQAAVSERMDGERLAPKRETQLEGHLIGCARCRAFVERAWRIRESVRFEVLTEVPDLVGTIMAQVSEEAGRSRTRRRLLPWRVGAAARFPSSQSGHHARGGWPGPGMDRPTLPEESTPRGARLGGRRGLRRELARLAVALLAGAVVGATVVSTGVWRDEDRAAPGVASAAEVSDGVARAAAELRSLHVRYLVTERNFKPAVPERTFSVDVWFGGPERFRLDVVDHTTYPAQPHGSWPRNDLTLIVDGSRSYSSVPAHCPRDAFPTCPFDANRVRRLQDQAPFAALSPGLTDAVLPVVTLAEEDRLTVLGRGQVEGREVVQVELAFEHAQPLFAVLQQGGSWRPFYAGDRVVLSLDRESWLPLQYRVYPAGGEDRKLWAFRFGLPEEPPDRSVFSASVVTVEEGQPSPDTFAIPSGPAESEGTVDLASIAKAAEELGRKPLVPADTANLELYRVSVDAARPGGPSEDLVVTFASGLAWLEVRETGSWSGPGPFGGVSGAAEQVELASGGVAYYEPATGELGRRLAIHAQGVDLYLETNLGRGQLLEVAASIPVRGEPLPRAWLVRQTGEGSTERVPVEIALSAIPVTATLPTLLPAGYRAVSAELVRLGETVAANVFFQAEETAVAGPIRLHLEAADALPPASGAEQFTVTVSGAPGRWTPDRGTLEWVADGLYRSLSADGFDLSQLLPVAESMDSGGGASTSSAGTLRADGAGREGEVDQA